MMRGRQLPVENFVVRSYRERERLAALPVSSPIKWARPHVTTLAIGGPLCRLSMLAWNGDRARGWTFYCTCGHCTPMRRSFSEGLEILEVHWLSRRPA